MCKLCFGLLKVHQNLTLMVGGHIAVVLMAGSEEQTKKQQLRTQEK